MNDVRCQPKKCPKLRSQNPNVEDKHEVYNGCEIVESRISFKQTAPPSTFKGTPCVPKFCPIYIKNVEVLMMVLLIQS